MGMNSEKIYVKIADKEYIEMKKEEFETFPKNFVIIDKKLDDKSVVFRKVGNVYRRYKKFKVEECVEVAIPITIQYLLPNDIILTAEKRRRLLFLRNILETLKNVISNGGKTNLEDLEGIMLSKVINSVYTIHLSDYTKYCKRYSEQPMIKVGFLFYDIIIPNVENSLEVIRSYDLLKEIDIILNFLNKNEEKLKLTENRKPLKFLYFNRSLFEIEDDSKLKNCLIYEIVDSDSPELMNGELMNGDRIYVPINAKIVYFKGEKINAKDLPSVKEIKKAYDNLENLIDSIKNKKVIHTDKFSFPICVCIEDKINVYRLPLRIRIEEFDFDFIESKFGGVRFIETDERKFVDYLIEIINSYDVLEILEKAKTELEKYLLLSVFS